MISNCVVNQYTDKPNSHGTEVTGDPAPLILAPGQQITLDLRT